MLFRPSPARHPTPSQARPAAPAPTSPLQHAEGRPGEISLPAGAAARQAAEHSVPCSPCSQAAGGCVRKSVRGVPGAAATLGAMHEVPDAGAMLRGVRRVPDAAATLRGCRQQAQAHLEQASTPAACACSSSSPSSCALNGTAATHGSSPAAISTDASADHAGPDGARSAVSAVPSAALCLQSGAEELAIRQAATGIGQASGPQESNASQSGVRPETSGAALAEAFRITPAPTEAAVSGATGHCNAPRLLLPAAASESGIAKLPCRAEPLCTTPACDCCHDMVSVLPAAADGDADAARDDVAENLRARIALYSRLIRFGCPCACR